MVPTTTQVRKSVFDQLDELFERLNLQSTAVRERFTASWSVLQRHAPLFGCAEHPDLDPEQLDEVLDDALSGLASEAREGRREATRDQAVAQFVRALSAARGLPARRMDEAFEALLVRQTERLAHAVGGGHVPMLEAFTYHQALARHYDVEREALRELVGWTCEALEHPQPSGTLARFVAACRRAQTAPRSRPGRSQVSSLRRAAVPAVSVDQRDPSVLVQLVSTQAPGLGSEAGAGAPVSQHWYLLLSDALERAGVADERAAEVGEVKVLPSLVESALLVHLLGLEGREHKAVLSAAADRLLMHRLVPAARAVGGRHNRHEPIAAYLVTVLARALRPWSFTAAPLQTEHRVVMLAMLAELATSKSRKLLHQAKLHADGHASPELIRAAVNRGLARLPKRVEALSPKQRIDRVAAGFRYLNRQRRGAQPRARDLAIVGELLA